MKLSGMKNWKGANQVDDDGVCLEYEELLNAVYILVFLTICLI